MDYKLNPAERFSRAIIDLQEKQPFFAHLALGMQVREMTPEERKVNTASMGVNARGELVYAPEWVETLSREEMCGVVSHEVLHLALQHMFRLGRRRHQVANVAMDIVVNYLVLANGQKLPSMAIPVDVDEKKGWFSLQKKDGSVVKVVVKGVDERPWEDVYEEILQYFDDEDGDGKGGKGGTKGPKGFDDHEFGEGKPGEKEQSEQWKDRVVEGLTVAKQRGNVPVGMERLVEQLMKPKVQWKEVLRSYVKPYLMPTDLSYQKPNKKSHAVKVFLPVVRKEHYEVEVLVDTSGSISQEELTEFLSEIVGIANSNIHVKMWVSFCDTQIHERVEVSNGNIPALLAKKIKGGGGTQMEAGLDEIKQRNASVPVVVVLTDGEDRYERKRWEYPFEVIWVLSKNGVGIAAHAQRCNYGSRVKID